MMDIAVIGSSKLADELERRKKVKEFLIVYQAYNTSIISMMSAPIAYDREKMIALEEQKQNILQDEMRKDFVLQLCSVDASLLLMDFIPDVMQGVIETTSGNYLTNLREEFSQEEIYKNVEIKRILTVAENYEEYLTIWKKYFDQFIRFAEEYIPATKIIVCEHIVSLAPQEKKALLEMLEYVKSKGFELCDLSDEKKADVIFAVQRDLLKKAKVCNLLLNADFHYGSQFWKWWDCPFEITGDVAYFEEGLGFSQLYNQTSSCEICNSGSQEYTCSFRYRICDRLGGGKDAVILVIRTYMERNRVAKADCKEQFLVTVNNTVGEWKQIDYSFTATGKYISVGLFVKSTGFIEWSDLCVHKGPADAGAASSPYRKYLLGNHELIDLNIPPEERNDRNENLKNKHPIIEVKDVGIDFKVATSNSSGLKEYMVKLLTGKVMYRKLHALEHINFNIYPGEVVGIIGTNGSGKSTLLKIISGILKPSYGQVIVDRKHMQYLTFGSGFDNELTGRENVYLNGAIVGLSKEFLDEHYDEIVAFAELDGFMEEKVKNYSSGMRSRLGFAIATAGSAADILILDEVLSVGDEFFRKKSMARVQELIHGGSTVLIVSHSMQTILTNCTKCIWIEQGKQRMVGPPKRVCAEYHKLKA